MPVEEVPELDGEIPENALKEHCRALHVALVTPPAAHTLLGFFEEVLRSRRIKELACEGEHLEDRLTTQE